MFKVGDEVVCVDAKGSVVLNKNATYTITEIAPKGAMVTTYEGARKRVSEDVVQLSEIGVWTCPGFYGFKLTRFRKVERKNSRLTLEAFFTVPGGFEEPKRTPAKKKTDA